MVLKYRVYEIAKDLGVTSKEILELVKNYTGNEKKHMTALENNELDIILDYYTQKHASESFDAYFATKPKERIRQLKTDEQKDDYLEETEPRSSAGENENLEKNKKTNRTTLKDLKETLFVEKKDGKSKIQKNFENKYLKKAKNKDLKENKRKNPEPAFTIEYAENPGSFGNKVRVDTRNFNVDIEKYNEKYENLASASVSTDPEHGGGKRRKLASKFFQKRRPKRGRRETDAERLRRIALERKKSNLVISVPEEISVLELSKKLKATKAEVMKKLIVLGLSVNSENDIIDFDTATLVALEFDAKTKKEQKVSIEELIIESSEDNDETLTPRAPVVVVMGHVDHGKTSLLDAIRKTNVTSGEAGGITQHIGAYRVNISNKDITFLDTPGHEAFTSMRARGAQITDIAILVVAADDGIMPQTIEAIHHAKAAGISIIVAINKMDKEDANPERVKQQLTEHAIVPEEWGGDVPCVPISAKTKKGIKELLEMVNLVAELKNLKANPNRLAKGTVIDAKLDKTKGPVASLLVQNGTLRVGDILVAGTSVGKVRTMVNDKGQNIKEAKPSVPVRISGLASVPMGGDEFDAVKDERLAKELVEQRRYRIKEERFNSLTKVTLDNLYDQMALGDVKELKVIVKADVSGSAEAIKQSLERLSNNEVRVNVIHSAPGSITESDIMLASASCAIVVGFNVRPEGNASLMAERLGVDVRLYRVIYDCTNEIEKSMKGLKEPRYKETILGKAECRHIYKISGIGVISGSYVLEGKIEKNNEVRVIRDGAVIAEDTIASLKRFKEDAKEVLSEYECGIGLSKFNDIKLGDIFETFVTEKIED